MSKLKAYRTERMILIHGLKGTIFFTTKKDREITAMSIYYKRKVRTEVMVLVSGSKTNPLANPIVKVTIVN